jgi:plasmid stabilization system protein ParE
VTDARRELEFVYTARFDAAAADLLDDEAMRHVELSLLAEPRAGAVVAGTSGIRKLRTPLPGRGKRGRARVLYL